VEFCRGISNPIAIKVGPTTDPEDACALVRKLNPDSIPGRLTLITRFGAKKVESMLPPIVKAGEKQRKCSGRKFNYFF
jgi:3-deoxy-7-phosphoheptulonate synthase